MRPDSCSYRTRGCAGTTEFASRSETARRNGSTSRRFWSTSMPNSVGAGASPARPSIDIRRPKRPPLHSELLADARDWCRGKMWIPRALLLAFLVYIELLKIGDATRWTIFYGITLGFHEMGHLLT